MTPLASTSARVKPEIIDLTALDEEDSEQDEQDGSEEDEDDDDDDDEEDSGQASDGSDDSVQVQVNGDTRARLYLTLATLPETQIRSILNQLIEQVPAVEYALTRKLVPPKRKLDYHGPKLYHCLNCHEEFDPMQKRTKTECQYHHRVLEPDETMIPEWDEDARGPLDTPTNRREHPTFFWYTCCYGDGASKGCLYNYHEIETLHKRIRIS
ncbi:hypothetical protein FB446DRAFT_643700 [Lentinula raphanica]|nr:hypothetical protein FB446DRAFT_643700 [Lentinula raphanica]KAJ3829603.1 hypothetical protein F5880DRAFT_1470295 [Lentinula raphanica]